MNNLSIKGKKFFHSYFKLHEHGTNIKTEVLAGFTTFVTMAYALLVIPNILKVSGMNGLGLMGDAANAMNSMNDSVIAAAFVAMCLVSAAGTLMMSLYSNLPFAVAPGIGLTAFFSYSVCLKLGYTWQQGLAAVSISGTLFILITLTSLREKIIQCLPDNIKKAMTAGIGLFITLIGLKSGGIIVADPSTLVGFGNLTNNNVLLTIIGLTLMCILMVRRVKGAMLIAILLTTIIGIPMGITHLSGVKFISAPASIAPIFMKMDYHGLFSHEGAGVIGAITSIIMVILTFSLVDLFDTLGTLIGTAQKAEMIRPDGSIRSMKKALLTDAVSTTFGSFFGMTTTSTYIESTAGIAEGGRTGLTTLVVGSLFLVATFLGGIIGMVPSQATAPALIMVGILMMESIKHVDFTDLTEAIPGFLTITLMPFTYSITNGVAAGMISYPIMKLAVGKGKEVNIITYILAILFIIRFAVIK
ncbi:MAG: NCS2 family permease [Desulfobacteraceae bacterium]|nr:NCS2 family permease [Desulfobacteraceae bacterium]